MWGGKEFHIFGAAIRKTREPNERLCRGTESKLLVDEHVDVVGFCLLILWKMVSVTKRLIDSELSSSTIGDNLMTSESLFQLGHLDEFTLCSYNSRLLAATSNISRNSKCKRMQISSKMLRIVRIFYKKLSYRRETARQLPTWRGLSPLVHSPSLLWLHLCVRSNPKPATNVRQACRP